MRGHWAAARYLVLQRKWAAKRNSREWILNTPMMSGLLLCTALRSQLFYRKIDKNRRVRVWKYMVCHAKSNQCERNELGNDVLFQLNWEKMSIAPTSRLEIKELCWLKDALKQDPYVMYVFSALFSTIWADMIDQKGIRRAAVRVFRATCSTFDSLQFHIPLCNVWVR